MPFEIMFSRQAALPIDIELGIVEPEDKLDVFAQMEQPNMSELQKKRTELLDCAKQNSLSAQEKQDSLQKNALQTKREVPGWSLFWSQTLLVRRELEGNWICDLRDLTPLLRYFPKAPMSFPQKLVLLFVCAKLISNCTIEVLTTLSCLASPTTPPHLTR